MPGMIWMETLRAQHPKLRCMLMSAIPRTIPIDPRWFLRMPFDPDVLLP